MNRTLTGFYFDCVKNTVTLSFIEDGEHHHFTASPSLIEDMGAELIGIAQYIIVTEEGFV